MQYAHDTACGMLGCDAHALGPSCMAALACMTSNPAWLLSPADPPRPFDFIIDEQLLRRSLQQHLLENKLSAVRTLWHVVA